MYLKSTFLLIMMRMLSKEAPFLMVAFSLPRALFSSPLKIIIVLLIYILLLLLAVAIAVVEVVVVWEPWTSSWWENRFRDPLTLVWEASAQVQNDKGHVFEGVLYPNALGRTHQGVGNCQSSCKVAKQEELRPIHQVGIEGRKWSKPRPWEAMHV